MGSIDATVLKSNSDYYLVWKDDGNDKNPKVATTIWAAKLNPNGLYVEGAWTNLLHNTLGWEADVTEGPWFIFRNGWYYLFYSGHGYCDSSYAVGVARSKNPLGPYEKKGNPILASNHNWVGPGHCSVVPRGNDYVMIYHTWINGAVCGSNKRVMNVDTV